MKQTFSALTGARVQGLVRLVLLVLCCVVAATASNPAKELFWAAPLGLAGFLSSRVGRGRGWEMATICAEGLTAGCAVVATGSGTSPFLPYLIAPAFAGGLALGVFGGVVPVGATAAVVLMAPLAVPSAPTPNHLSSGVAQWIVLAILVGIVALWTRGVLVAANEGTNLQQTQVEAFRLLTELRSVARRLPGTLDPATSADAMLERAREHVRFESGAVVVSVGGSQQLTVVARTGPGRPHWDLSLTESSPLGNAWRTQQGLHLGRQLPRTDEGAHGGSSLVVPLLSGDRTFGLVILESGVAQAFPPEAIEHVGAAVTTLAMQLQTGLVFEEVRELATYEERRRLAREIHDGIAQELASLAYALDTVADEAEGHSVAPQVNDIRNQVRRLVTELRMSLFDLRSDVDPDEGLGAAIGRHVRAVGAASGLTVHLSLNEAPVRLGAETEAELLRIVQEAVANTRKHAKAANLWVTCTVDPPGAAITVEDDGVGLNGTAGFTHHGLAIMQERATRIRADLLVEQRRPRGTRVSLALGRVRS
jgi:two-component sensor histidine kinase